jgi:hypothetical protein
MQQPLVIQTRTHGVPATKEEGENLAMYYSDLREREEGNA